MPELPEVETMRRGLEPVVGATIRRLRTPRSHLRPIDIRPRPDRLRRALVGRRIAALERVGKRLAIRLEGDDRLVIEPRMTGRVHLAQPSIPTYVRLLLDLDDAPSPGIVFWDQRGLGTVRLMSPWQFEEDLGPRRIGPDALTITGAELRAGLAPSRRAIKVALLDQSVVAGIGNIYAAEILHRIGLHPAAPCFTLRASHFGRLQQAMVEVLREAIAAQGSTLSDGTYRSPRDQTGGFQRCFRVYQREGEVCGTCGRAKIVRIVQAQRSTFFCPRCQRSRHAS